MMDHCTVMLEEFNTDTWLSELHEAETWSAMTVDTFVNSNESSIAPRRKRTSRMITSCADCTVVILPATVMPPPGAVWPAMVRYELVMTSGENKLMVPAMS